MNYDELAAVNRILSAQGLPPVATLEGATSKNTQIALNVLRQVNADVQSEGWAFNTEYDYTLALSAAGFIEVPDNVTRWYCDSEPWLIQRGNRLYNRADQTYVFDTAKTGTAQLRLPWDELPIEAKTYIAARAARMVYDQYVGSDENRQNLFLVERDAQTVLDQQEADTGHNSMLDDARLPWLRGSQYVPGSPRWTR